jgi:hypothetical protein
LLLLLLLLVLLLLFQAGSKVDHIAASVCEELAAKALWDRQSGAGSWANPNYPSCRWQTKKDLVALYVNQPHHFCWW